MKKFNFIKKVLFVIGISILLPIGNKAYPFLENQQPKIQLPRQPFSNAKKQLPMAGGDDNKIELLAYDVTNIYVFAWEFEGQAITENMPWPQEGHDPQHTGRVSITVQPKKGDINADGVVDVIDVQACVNIILGLTEGPDKKADVNDDEIIDASDLQMIVNIILLG